MREKPNGKLDRLEFFEVISWPAPWLDLALSDASCAALRGEIEKKLLRCVELLKTIDTSSATPLLNLLLLGPPGAGKSTFVVSASIALLCSFDSLNQMYSLFFFSFVCRRTQLLVLQKVVFVKPKLPAPVWAPTVAR